MRIFRACKREREREREKLRLAFCNYSVYSLTLSENHATAITVNRAGGFFEGNLRACDAIFVLAILGRGKMTCVSFLGFCYSV